MKDDVIRVDVFYTRMKRNRFFTAAEDPPIRVGTHMILLKRVSDVAKCSAGVDFDDARAPALTDVDGQ